MTPLHVGTSYTHDFGFYSKGNASATHQSMWAVSLNHKLRGWWGICTPFEPPLMGGHSPLKFPAYTLFRPKGGRKTINVFSHIHRLVSNTNYKHLECFLTLGTHSEPRRGQMSHICDISSLRVEGNASRLPSPITTVYASHTSPPPHLHIELDSTLHLVLFTQYILNYPRRVA